MNKDKDKLKAKHEVDHLKIVVDGGQVVAPGSFEYQNRNHQVKSEQVTVRGDASKINSVG